MQPTERTFDRSSLISAWFSQKKYRHAHQDLQSYHDAVYAALAKAFRINLDVAPGYSPIARQDRLYDLFLDVIDSYEKIHSPFSSYMCGTPEISEMYQKYGKSLDEAAMAICHIHMKLLIELVERIWGADVPHRVSQQELENFGHPGWDEPDPVDYW